MAKIPPMLQLSVTEQQAEYLIDSLESQLDAARDHARDWGDEDGLAEHHEFIAELEQLYGYIRTMLGKQLQEFKTGEAGY